MTELIKTNVYFFTPENNSGCQIKEYKLEKEPGFEEIRKIFEEFIPDCDMEHVSVLFDPGYIEAKDHVYKGKPTDMFVDEIGVLKGLPANFQATQIYMANTIRKYGPAYVTKLLQAGAAPLIHGPAIVFDRQVWF